MTTPTQAALDAAKAYANLFVAKPYTGDPYECPSMGWTANFDAFLAGYARGQADAAKDREADLAAIQEGIAALDRMVSGFRKGSGDEMKCIKCGQIDKGQTGEYPCSKCGLPTTHDAPMTRARVEEIRAFDPRDNALYGPAIRDLLAYIDTQAEALKVAKDALEGFHKYCIKPECQCWACLALARLESLERGAP